MAEFMKKELAGVGALIERIKNAIGIGTPVGTIIMWYGKVGATDINFPKGYLECNGGSFSQSTYPELYAVLGTTTLPNFNGRFPMGTTSTSNVGEVVAASLPNITGTFGGNKYGTNAGAFYNWKTANARGSSSGDGALGQVSFDASRSSSVYKSTTTTVQPPAIRVRYLIKAK